MIYRTHFLTKLQSHSGKKRIYCVHTCKPLVTGLTHDQMDLNAGSEVTQTQMTVAYETVFYSRGP